MRDICYVFNVMVKNPDGEITYEEHKILEKATPFGDACASGRIVRFYEELKKKGKIKDYRVIAD